MRNVFIGTITTTVAVERAYIYDPKAVSVVCQFTNTI